MKPDSIGHEGRDAGIRFREMDIETDISVRRKCRYFDMLFEYRKIQNAQTAYAAAVVGERVFQSAFLKLTCGLSTIQGDRIN